MSFALAGAHSRVAPSGRARRAAINFSSKSNLFRTPHQRQCIAVPMSTHERPLRCTATGTNGVNGHVKPQATRPSIAVTELKELSLSALKALGYTEDETAVLIEVS
jgi:hypothetical protein